MIVNDYNQEYDLNVRKRFYDLIIELKNRGVPVSGLGLQVHPVNHWLWPHEIWDTLEMYSDLEIPIHITELHQPSWNQEIEGGFRDGNWSQETQADFMEQIYRQCFGHPTVVSINYWGLSDRRIWIDGAGLIDEEYRPKPVFERLKELFKGEWTTQPFTAQTDANGEINFSGFYGKYELILPQDGQQHRVFELHLASKKENRVEFIL